MEEKIETTMTGLYGSRVIFGLYWDTGRENGNNNGVIGPSYGGLCKLWPFW